MQTAVENIHSYLLDIAFVPEASISSHKCFLRSRNFALFSCLVKLCQYVLPHHFVALSTETTYATPIRSYKYRGRYANKVIDPQQCDRSTTSNFCITSCDQ